MNKLVFSTLLVAASLASCSDDDDNSCKPGNETDLITPELAGIMISTDASTTPFNGALMVYPCLEDTTFYYGNYNKGGALVPINAMYVIKDGSVHTASLPVRLPLGDYNFLYWALPKNDPADSTYEASSITEPGLRIGANLADLSLSLRKVSYSDTTYNPVYDYLHAVNPIKVGTEKMQALLKRAVAGIKITLVNKDGEKMNESIASARILIGSIASRLNYYTAEPSDFTKTVMFPLTMASDSLSLSTHSTVMVFPSADNPLLTILLTLKNGQVKRFQKSLTDALVAGNRLILNVTIGELYSEETSSDGFEVVNWTETTENINFPSTVS